MVSKKLRMTAEDEDRGRLLRAEEFVELDETFSKPETEARNRGPNFLIQWSVESYALYTMKIYFAIV